MPRDQAAAAQLAAQSAFFDQPLQEGVALLLVADELLGLLGLRGSQTCDEPLRVGDKLDTSAQRRGLGVHLKADVGHFAGLQAEQRDWGTDGQSAQGIVEIEDVVSRDGLRLLHRGGPVREQGECAVGGRGLTVGDEGRRLEGNPADQQRHQRLGAHVDPIRAERDVQATGIPEACLGADEMIVGRVDEDLELD